MSKKLTRTQHDCWVEWARAAVDKGDLPEAERCYLGCIDSKYSKDQLVPYELARVYIKLKKLDDAMSLISQYIHTNDVYYAARANVYEAMGELALAEADHERRNRDRNSIDGMIRKALFYERTGNAAAAARDVEDLFTTTSRKSVEQCKNIREMRERLRAPPKKRKADDLTPKEAVATLAIKWQKIGKEVESAGIKYFEEQGMRKHPPQTCVVCLERPSDVLYIPCFHYVSCDICLRANTIVPQRCPQCNVACHGTLKYNQ